MEGLTQAVRVQTVVHDDGTKDVLFNSDDPAIEAWLNELFDIEREAWAVDTKLATSFQSVFDNWAENGVPSSCLAPDLRNALLGAWRFELGFSSSTFDRIDKTAKQRREGRKVTDTQVRAIADATSGSFVEKLNAVLAVYPDEAEATLRRRMTLELGYKPGRAQQPKPLRRKCTTCGKEFQPTIKGNETRCRLHRHD